MNKELERSNNPFVRFVHWFVVQKVRLERGKSYISALQNIALLLILFQGYGIPVNLQIVFALAAIVVLWVVGYLDETRVQGWQHENEYVTKLNPVVMRIDKNTSKPEAVVA